MADVSISKDPHKGLMALTKDVLASRILELHSELARERTRREAAEGTVWRAPETADSGQSLILSAPWPGGHPFRGEGYRDRHDGTWRWANGKPVERPVTHIADLPMPPARTPAASLPSVGSFHG
ncbi:hypothetical protein B2G69_07715 [Methylorubrum zatmanii]|nr:hypothetical protein [Methylorubrum zatmanii]ARO54042.1 hypothetical protein B2G69_07715 [Methylorubrum zatmanii]